MDSRQVWLHTTIHWFRRAPPEVQRQGLGCVSYNSFWLRNPLTGYISLGFPCNQFGGQEPGTDDDIDNFCKINHGVSFQLFKKSDVNGDKTNEVFKYLKDKKSQLGLTRIKWKWVSILSTFSFRTYSPLASRNFWLTSKETSWTDTHQWLSHQTLVTMLRSSFKVCF